MSLLILRSFFPFPLALDPSTQGEGREMGGLNQDSTTYIVVMMRAVAFSMMSRNGFTILVLLKKCICRRGFLLAWVIRRFGTVMS